MSGVAPVSAWLVYLPGVTAVRTAKDLQGSQVKRQVRMCLARADVVDVQCDPVVLRPAAELTPFVIRGQRIVGSLQESDRYVRQIRTDTNASRAASSDGLFLSSRSSPGPGRSPVS
jgi:hypothetical protein